MPSKKQPWYADGKHPFYLVLRQITVMTPLMMLLVFGYKNGWSAADFKTLIIPLLSLAGFDIAKRVITGAKTEGDA